MAEKNSPQPLEGKARAIKLSPEKRKAVSSRAASVRWEKEKNKLPSTKHEGVLRIGEAELDVAVLDDGKIIISKDSFFKSFGRPNRGVKSKLHQWLTDDVGNLMLDQHLYSIIMMQRLAIVNGYG